MAASIEDRDGLQIGVGGRPWTFLELYGEFWARSSDVILLSSFA